MLLIKGRPIDALGYYFDVPPGACGGAAHYSGEVARRLGLDGRAVLEAEFRTLLEDPSSPLNIEGAPVARRRHAFFDVLLALPKSVSLLFALSPEVSREQVLAAQVQARGETLDYLERHGIWVREPAGARRFLRADGMLWAAFTHHVTRNGDPHLHSHVLIANRVPSSARGWSVLDLRSLHGERAATEALHAASLRHELITRLDVSFRDRSAPHSDVAGFSDRVIEIFSSRRAEISRNGGDQFKGRPAKRAEPAMAELLQRWQSEALATGFLSGRDPGSRRSQTAQPFERDRRGSDAARVVAVAAERAARFRSPFVRSDLVVAVCNELSTGAPVPDVTEAVAAALSGLELDSTSSVLGAPDLSHRPRRLFANEQVQSALAAESRAVGHARCGDLAGVASGDVAWPEHGAAFYLETIATPIASYGLVRALRTQAALRALPLRVRAPSDYARAAFESATGFVAGGHDRLRGPGGLTVLVDAWSFDATARSEMVSSAASRGDLVVVLDRVWRRAPHLVPTPCAPSPLSVWRSHAHQTGPSSEVCFVDSLERALAVVNAYVAHFGERTEVRADWRLRGLFGARADRASLALQTGPDSFLVSLGDSSLVARDDAMRARAHVVVRAPDACDADDKAIAHVIAGWTISHRSSRSRPQLAERIAWGWREAVRDRERSAIGAKSPGPERVVVGGSQGEMRHARSEDQHGRVTWPVRDAIGRETSLSP